VTHPGLVGQCIHNWLRVVKEGDTVKADAMGKVSIGLLETSAFSPTAPWLGLGYSKQSRRRNLGKWICSCLGDPATRHTDRWEARVRHRRVLVRALALWIIETGSSKKSLSPYYAITKSQLTQLCSPVIVFVAKETDKGRLGSLNHIPHKRE
jgi:hypothetical protein